MSVHNFMTSCIIYYRINSNVPDLKASLSSLLCTARVGGACVSSVCTTPPIPYLTATSIGVRFSPFSSSYNRTRTNIIIQSSGIKSVGRRRSSTVVGNYENYLVVVLIEIVGMLACLIGTQSTQLEHH